MIKKDLQKFVEILEGLAENFSANLTEPGITMRFKALKRFEIQEIEEAAFAILATRKYTGTMPTVAEFLDRLQGNPEDIAQIEAGKVLRAIKIHGGMKSVAFDNATTQAVIVQHFGGWPKLTGELIGSDEKWFIKDFCSAYAAFAREGIEHLGYLPGTFEIENSSRGFDIHTRIRYIGDRARAKMIASRSDGEGVFVLPTEIKQLTSSIGG